MTKQLILFVSLIIVLCLGAVITLTGVPQMTLETQARTQPLTGSGPTDTPELLPPVTAAPVTPSIPITESSQVGPSVYYLGAENFVDNIAFKPNDTDIAFTVEEGYQKGEQELYLYQSDGVGNLTGPVTQAAGWPDADMLAVKSNNTAGKYAAAVSEWSGEHRGEYLDDIVIVDGGTTQQFNLTNGDIQISDFWWLPDGSGVIILDSSGTLIEKPLDFSAESTLATNLVGESGFAQALVTFSPDSNLVAIGTKTLDLKPQLDVVNRATHTRYTVAQWNFDNADMVPVFSNDGTEIYTFVAHSIGGISQLELYSVDPTPNAAPSLVATIPLDPGDSGSVTGAVGHPSGPELFYSRDFSLYKINTDGSGNIKIAGSETAKIWGELAIQVLENIERLAYVSTAYLAGVPKTPNTQPVSTEFTVHSIDLLTTP